MHDNIDDNELMLNELFLHFEQFIPTRLTPSLECFHTFVTCLPDPQICEIHMSQKFPVLQ